MSTNDPDSPTVGVHPHSNSPHFPKSKRIIHIGEIKKKLVNYHICKKYSHISFFQ